MNVRNLESLPTSLLDLCNCNNCRLAGPQRVFGYYPSNSDLPVLFVGEAPGKTETITGIPFTGSAGKMFFSLMRNANIRKNRANITNVVLCQPPENRNPYPDEIVCCFERLKNDILQLKPKLIIAVGKVASIALTGIAEIQKNRGSIKPLLDSYEYDCDVLIILHPAFVMRQRQWIQIAVNDLNRIHRFLAGDKFNAINFEFVFEPSLHELENYLDTDSIVAFDTETTGLDHFNDRVIGIAFAKNYNSAMALNFRDNDYRLPFICEWLNDATRHKSAQNGSFDIALLHNTFDVFTNGLVFDTRLAEQLINADLPTNLEFLRATYTDIQPYKPTKKQYQNLLAMAPEGVLSLACKDAVTTYQVMNAQKNILDKNQTKLFDELLMPLMPALVRMERRGVVINRDLLALAYSEIAPKVEQLEKSITDSIGINPNSPKQIVKKFKFKNSDKKTLQKHIDRRHPQSDILKQILDFRGLSKFASTYLIGLYKRLREHDNKLHYIHTEYHPDGTGTGRISSSDPNLQNIVEDYRYLFESEPGKLFIAADFKQVELYTAALLSRCDAMLNDLESGKDIHAIIQREIEPLLENFVAQSKLVGVINPRRIAKGVVFGTLYGASPYTFARDFRVSVDIAREWQAVLFEMYPELKIFIDKCTNDYETSGYITTPWGRRRRVYNSRQAVNTPIQSAASDITLSTLVEMDQNNFDLRLTIHDEIICQVDENDIDKNVEKITKIFTRPISAFDGYSFPCDIEIGPNWGELEKYEKAA